MITFVDLFSFYIFIFIRAVTCDTNSITLHLVLTLLPAFTKRSASERRNRGILRDQNPD